MDIKTLTRLGKLTLVIAATLILLIPSVEKVSGSAQSGTFSPTGSMNMPRSTHQAVLLRTGQVLVVGGVVSNSITDFNSAELYNPSTGKWTLTGNTLALHTSGTLTELANGEVLLAGGVDNPQAAGSDCLAAAELYNPKTGKWSATGSMTTGRCDQAATLLSNGEVLVAGGYSIYGDSVSSAELYNPATGSWQATGNMSTARQLAGIVTMLNGNALIVSGEDIDSVNGTSTALTSAEIYDASQGAFSTTASPGKFGANLVLLGNGNVLDVGIAFYTPATATWTPTGAYPPRGLQNGQRATLLGTGNVLITGFVNSYSGTGHPPEAAAVLYEPSSNDYVLTGSMTTPRLNHTMTLLPNGQVLVAGGFNRLNNTANFLASAELYTP
jgi:hypothetical protein